MLGKNSGQIDVFDHLIFEKLIPKDHLLVKIDSFVDFEFVYDKVDSKYSSLGRGSKDPAMMLKILVLEYLYKLSDVQVVNRIKTDVAFRWFLKLNIDDSVPDDTTISHFRVKRLGEEDFEEFFNEIVRQCIEKDLIKTKRYMIDSTDVAANANYPSDKKLIRNAYRNVIKEIGKFDDNLAKEQMEKLENEIDQEYKNNEKVSAKKHYEITNKYLNNIYIETYDELQTNERYKEAFGICHDIMDQHINKKGDKIISVVDPDARVAHKSIGNMKRGYKNHIIVDEDSEIILASVQTPFNIGDEKKLQELIEKVDKNLGIKPEEISADKAYGTIENRAYLKDNEITSNIAFYKEPKVEKKSFGIKDFIIDIELNSVICPSGIKSEDFKRAISNDKTYKKFIIDKVYCNKCSLRSKCFTRGLDVKSAPKSKTLMVHIRYDGMLKNMDRVKTVAFKKAYDKRYIVERRFATLVSNHGLRRCRSVRIGRAKTHITLANMACNIIRMVKLLSHPSALRLKIR